MVAGLGQTEASVAVLDLAPALAVAEDNQEMNRKSLLHSSLQLCVQLGNLRLFNYPLPFS